MGNEVETKEDHRIPIHVIPPIGEYAESLVPLLEKKSEVRLLMCASIKEAFEGAQKEPNSIVLLHVHAKEQIKGLLSILKAARRFLSKGKLVTILKFNTPELQNILIEYGCRDIIDERTPAKTVLFKIDKIVRIMALQSENQKGTEQRGRRQTPLNEKNAKDSDSYSRFSCEMTDPLNLSSDCFVFKEGSVHKIMGRITVRMQGPPPTAGRWIQEAFKESGGKEYSVWVWHPSSPLGEDPFVLEPGAWHFVGNRPDFIDLQWIFSGNPMELRFVAENKIVCRKLYLEPTGALKVCRNSPTTLSFVPKIEESLEKLVRLAADQQLKDSGTEIKNDRIEDRPDAVFEEEQVNDRKHVFGADFDRPNQMRDMRSPEAEMEDALRDENGERDREKPREMRDKRAAGGAASDQRGEREHEPGQEAPRDIRDRRSPEAGKEAKRGKPMLDSDSGTADNEKSGKRAKSASERQLESEKARKENERRLAEVEEKRGQIRAKIEAERKKKRTKKERAIELESEIEKESGNQERKIEESCEAVIDLAKERALKELCDQVTPERAREMLDKRAAEIDAIKKHAEEELAAESDPEKHGEIRKKQKEAVAQAKERAEKALAEMIDPGKAREIIEKKNAQIEKVKNRAEVERNKRREEEKRKREAAKQQLEESSAEDESGDEAGKGAGEGRSEESRRQERADRAAAGRQERLIQKEVAKMMARLPIGPGKPRLSPFSVGILMSNWIADGSRTPLEVAYLYCSASRAVLGDVDTELWALYNSGWSCVAKSHTDDAKFNEIVGQSRAGLYKDPSREVYVFPVLNQAKEVIGAFAIESKPKNEFTVTNFESMSELGTGILESQLRILAD